jgi:hypothetical protein
MERVTSFKFLEGIRIGIRKYDHVYENIGPPHLYGIAFIRIFVNPDEMPGENDEIPFAVQGHDCILGLF